MRYLVAIPVFNEAKTLKTVLRRVREYASNILVIDDGSTDETTELLRDETDIHLINHPRNLGYGQSLIDAFNFSAQHDYDWLITMDCDEQHHPEWIPQFLSAAEQNNADIISGSRYLSDMPNDSTVPPDRRDINQEITDQLNKTLNLRITDAFCGFKAYRVSALAKLALTVPGYAMPLQLWVQAVRHKLRIREIPVPLIYNDHERSFGGPLDEPRTRLNYYCQVIARELGDKFVPSDKLIGRHKTAGQDSNEALIIRDAEL